MYEASTSFKPVGHFQQKFYPSTKKETLINFYEHEEKSKSYRIIDSVINISMFKSNCLMTITLDNKIQETKWICFNIDTDESKYTQKKGALDGLQLSPFLSYWT